MQGRVSRGNGRRKRVRRRMEARGNGVARWNEDLKKTRNWPNELSFCDGLLNPSGRCGDFWVVRDGPSCPCGRRRKQA